MNSIQPPYLHQNEPSVRLLPPAQADNFSSTQAFNLWTCLLLVTLGLLGHSLSQLLTGLAFAGVWTYGIYTPNAKQYRFYLITLLLAAATPFIIGFPVIH